MEYKKKVKVLKYQDHPELENKVVECVIMNNEKIEPRMKGIKQNKKPKQPRITINQLAIEMRAGFAAVNHRMDVEFAAVNQRMNKIDNRMDKIENDINDIKKTLKRNNIN
jgi:hypothetical protein